MPSIRLKSLEEIQLIFESAQLVSKTLGVIASIIGPGITGKELDKIAEEFICDNGGRPGFKGMYGFPSTLCISSNNVVVHGIPNDKPFKDGDIVSIDCGVLMNGFYGDHAYTFEIGEVDAEIRKLINATKDALYKGIFEFRFGNRVGDISNAIESHIRTFGYGIVRDLVGHGLGRDLHEPPQVPNFGRKGHGKKLTNGMVLAIEPMINLGSYRVITESDKTTISTKDGLVSVHFEHDVAMINNRPVLLSTFDYIYQSLGISSDEEDAFRYSSKN